MSCVSTLCRISMTFSLSCSSASGSILEPACSRSDTVEKFVAQDWCASARKQRRAQYGMLHLGQLYFACCWKQMLQTRGDEAAKDVGVGRRCCALALSLRTAREILYRSAIDMSRSYTPRQHAHSWWRHWRQNKNHRIHVSAERGNTGQIFRTIERYLVTCVVPSSPGEDRKTEIFENCAASLCRLESSTHSHLDTSANSCEGQKATALATTTTTHKHTAQSCHIVEAEVAVEEAADSPADEEGVDSHHEVVVVASAAEVVEDTRMQAHQRQCNRWGLSFMLSRARCCVNQPTSSMCLTSMPLSSK